MLTPEKKELLTLMFVMLSITLTAVGVLMAAMAKRLRDGEKVSTFDRRMHSLAIIGVGLHMVVLFKFSMGMFEGNEAMFWVLLVAIPPAVALLWRVIKLKLI